MPNEPRASPDRRCVYCRRRSVDPDWRPFCSERCKLLDLGRWIEGTYRAPGEPVAQPQGGGGPETEEDEGEPSR